jgi:hypothetical protein
MLPALHSVCMLVDGLATVSHRLPAIVLGIISRLSLGVLPMP